MQRITDLALACVLCFVAASSLAVLPAPTAEQSAAAAAKKDKADAQAKLAQQALLAKMDAIADRWRSNARGHGWTVYEPVPIPAPTEALKAPADTKPAPAAAGAAVPASMPAPAAASPSKGTP